MAWAVLAVSVATVVVGAVGAYIAWRQSRSGEIQAEVARTTFDANALQRHESHAPEIRASILDFAVDAFNRPMPTTVRISNLGTTNLTHLEVEFVELPAGVAGFYSGDNVVPRVSVGALRAYGEASVRLALEPVPPARIAAVLHVTCGVDSEPPWRMSVPCTWVRPAPIRPAPYPRAARAPGPYAQTPRAAPRRLLLFALIATALAAAVIWASLKLLDIV